MYPLVRHDSLPAGGAISVLAPIGQTTQTLRRNLAPFLRQAALRMVGGAPDFLAF